MPPYARRILAALRSRAAADRRRPLCPRHYATTTARPASNGRQWDEGASPERARVRHTHSRQGATALGHERGAWGQDESGDSQLRRGEAPSLAYTLYFILRRGEAPSLAYTFYFILRRGEAPSLVYTLYFILLFTQAKAALFYTTLRCAA